ncbi:hypothetical protein JTE90_026888 [Oedothorax gibbosus]|uniref:Uncharacterized protein n=1 Tax=Oedothorax gibbosus TaxID=931172 RepID=A0AAV6TEU5_9ARAC|nr:hypothetical protein JTE90_026888 [Oedothorax gibbosus]
MKSLDQSVRSRVVGGGSELFGPQELHQRMAEIRLEGSTLVGRDALRNSETGYPTCEECFGDGRSSLVYHRESLRPAAEPVYTGQDVGESTGSW